MQNKESKAYQKIKQKAEQRELERKMMLGQVLDTYEGRTIIWDFIERCKIFTKGFADGNVAYYYQGMKDVGLSIIEDIIELDENIYNKMVTESQRRNKDAR